MPGARTPEIAGRLFLAALGSAASCITRQQFELTSYHYRPDILLTAAFPAPVSLRSPSGGPSGLLFEAARGFSIVEVDRARFRPRWHAITRMYEYRVLSHDQTELLVYHWQPGDAFAGPDHPHLHVSAAVHARVDAASGRSIDLDKRHLATGPVPLEAVVRMLIEEFAIAPLRHDWRETLARVTTDLSEALL